MLKLLFSCQQIRMTAINCAGSILTLQHTDKYVQYHRYYLKLGCYVCDISNVSMHYT